MDGGPEAAAGKEGSSSPSENMRKKASKRKKEKEEKRDSHFAAKLYAQLFSSSRIMCIHIFMPLAVQNGAFFNTRTEDVAKEDKQDGTM